MPTARWWKEFYAKEREELGTLGLDALLEQAPSVELSRALVFPHTRLRHSGHLPAAAARAVLDSGADTVLALGVLHGGREQDAEVVARARAGDANAIAALGGVHGPDGIAVEEFSLDGFSALLERAAERAGRAPPRLVKRFPFLVGRAPDQHPGLEELARLVASGAAVVATADMVHHGVGYGTAEGERVPREAGSTYARGLIEEQLLLLGRRDFVAFADVARRARSDFRDSGPTLAALIAPFSYAVLALELVPYGDVLAAAEPTWVAAALCGLA